MLYMAVTCNDSSTLCVVIRQVGTVLSSKDHPRIAAVATFAEPADRDGLIPIMCLWAKQQHSVLQTLENQIQG